MASQSSNITVQGSVTFGPGNASTSTQTSAAEQSHLSTKRIENYLNNSDHSTTYASATYGYTNDQASVIQHHTAAASSNIQNFDAVFYSNANDGGQ